MLFVLFQNRSNIFLMLLKAIYMAPGHRCFPLIIDNNIVIKKKIIIAFINRYGAINKFDAHVNRPPQMSILSMYRDVSR